MSKLANEPRKTPIVSILGVTETIKKAVRLERIVNCFSGCVDELLRRCRNGLQRRYLSVTQWVNSMKNSSFRVYYLDRITMIYQLNK